MAESVNNQRRDQIWVGHSGINLSNEAQHKNPLILNLLSENAPKKDSNPSTQWEAAHQSPQKGSDDFHIMPFPAEMGPAPSFPVTPPPSEAPSMPSTHESELESNGYFGLKKWAQNTLALVNACFSMLQSMLERRFRDLMQKKALPGQEEVATWLARGQKCQDVEAALTALKFSPEQAPDTKISEVDGGAAQVSKLQKALTALGYSKEKKEFWITENSSKADIEALQIKLRAEAKKCEAEYNRCTVEVDKALSEIKITEQKMSQALATQSATRKVSIVPLN